MKKSAALIIAVLLFTFTEKIVSQVSQAKKVYSEENIIQQYNERIVYSTFESDAVKDGITVLAKDKKGIIVVGNKGGYMLNFAAQEIQKYIKISMGIDLEIKNDIEITKEEPKNYLIILGNSSNNLLIKKLKIKIDDYNLGNDGCLIKVLKHPFDKTAKVVVIGGEKSKGVLNGAYTFLNKTINIEWFPPRIHRNYMEYFVDNSIYYAGYYRVKDEHRFQIETYVERKKAISWPEQEIVEKPVIKDAGMIYDKHQFRKSVIDWSIKNKINTIVVFVDIHFPLHVDESNRLKDVVKYAHKFGMKVHFFTFTHVCSKDSRKQYSEIHVSLDKSYKDKDEGTYVVDNPRTLQESTKLMVNLVQEYDLDGIGWHPASERIDKTIEEGKPEYYWETVYVTEYYNAIQKIKSDAKIFFVLGWEYMNPPDELRKYIPEGVIAWIVPSRAWTRQYMEKYFENFSSIWFWLYPWYGIEGVFPHYIIERMQKYVKEGASKNILGIVPEMYTFRNHEMNAMSLIKLYWNTELDAEKFKEDFNDKYYYHNEIANLASQSYIQKDYWGAYNLFKEAYLQSNNIMIRDRLKDMAISSLRLIEDPAADTERMYNLCKEAEQIFIDHYISNEETDLFYIILNELTEKWQKQLSEKNE